MKLKAKRRRSGWVGRVVPWVSLDVRQRVPALHSGPEPTRPPSQAAMLRPALTGRRAFRGLWFRGAGTPGQSPET
jgi:hypothetical protein